MCVKRLDKERLGMLRGCLASEHVGSKLLNLDMDWQEGGFAAKQGVGAHGVKDQLDWGLAGKTGLRNIKQIKQSNETHTRWRAQAQHLRVYISYIC